MTKLYLSQEAFDALLKVSKEISVPQSELVSELILQFVRKTIEERETPAHRCGMCSLRFFSSGALENHLQKHSKIVVEK